MVWQILVKSLISQSIMKEMKYLSRIADKTLDLRLEAFGAVQIAGPK